MNISAYKSVKMCCRCLVAAISVCKEFNTMIMIMLIYWFHGVRIQKRIFEGDIYGCPGHYAKHRLYG